jgi:hypothetical protein|nr:MAG TPA: hypothetical protein [Caudoviricetes sp.]
MTRNNLRPKANFRFNGTKKNSGLLSQMKERDGNEKLNKICLENYKKDLTK